MGKVNYQTKPEYASRPDGGPEPGSSTVEDEIIARARDRNIDAFNQLILAYQRLAYSVALRVLQDQASADDAVQDSFIKAYRHLDGFKGGNFKSWLMRIVVNTCYDELRSQQRRRTGRLDDLVKEPEPVSSLGSRPETPEQYSDRMELHAALETAIGSLPDDQRTAVVLCDVHGFAYDEIAEMTGWPMGTVKSRINRGRVKLRDMLLQRPELLPPSFRPNTD